jgi:hypothetical protein
LCGVAFGQAEDSGDDAHGKREGQSADQICTTDWSERVDELVEDASDELVLPAGEELGAERGCDQSAVGPVFGFVHCNHCVVERRAHELADDVRRVGLVVSQHRNDFVVAEHADPRVAIQRGGGYVVRKRPLELHRPLPAGRRESGVGIVDGAELDRVGQLERIETRSFATLRDRHFNSPARLTRGGRGDDLGRRAHCGRVWRVLPNRPPNSGGDLPSRDALPATPAPRRESRLPSGS